MLMVAALVWLADQASKLYVVRNLALGEVWAPIPSLERFFTFTRTTNTGAAFGLFPNVGGLFVLIAIGVIIGIIMFYPRLPTEHWFVLPVAGMFAEQIRLVLAATVFRDRNWLAGRPPLPESEDQ